MLTNNITVTLLAHMKTSPAFIPGVIFRVSLIEKLSFRFEPPKRLTMGMADGAVQNQVHKPHARFRQAINKLIVTRHGHGGDPTGVETIERFQPFLDHEQALFRIGDKHFPLTLTHVIFRHVRHVIKETLRASGFDLHRGVLAGD